MVDDIPPGWHPDPLGRHRYRFWNGAQWTDVISDGGPAQSEPNPSGSAGPVPPSPPPTTRGRRRPTVLMALAVLVAAGVAAALLVVTQGDNDTVGGTGEFRQEVEDGSVVVHEVRLRAGDAVGFDVISDPGDLEFRAAISVRGGTAGKVEDRFNLTTEDAYSEEDYEEFFTDGQGDRRILVASRRRGGRFVQAFVAPASGTYTLVMVSADEGELRYAIEKTRKEGLGGDLSSEEIAGLRLDDDYEEFFDSWSEREREELTDFDSLLGESEGS